MAELATSAGLPRPEIEEGHDCVTVRFRRAGVVLSGQRDRDHVERKEAILAMLDRAENGLALREIAAKLTPDVSARQVKRALAALRNLELAEPTGRGMAARLRRLQPGRGKWTPNTPRGQ